MTILLVHGYMGFPQNCWFPWLKKELEARGHEVIAPAMPHPALPKRSEWVETLKKIELDPASTVLVGHSLGCVALLNLLQDHEGEPFVGAVMASGFGRDFMHVNGLVHWFDRPFDFSGIKARARSWTNIHSKNDPLVPFVEGEWLSGQLGSKLVVENKGHLTKAEGACELPSVLDVILEMDGVLKGTIPRK